MAQSVFSEPFEVKIPPMTMAKDRVISANPEEEVMTRLRNWAQEQGADLAQARAFGFDVPVSAAEKAQVLRGYEYWLQVPDTIVVPAQPVSLNSCEAGIKGGSGTHAVLVEPFPGGKYIALHITDPFADPFERIPRGWQTLVKYIKESRPSLDGGPEGGNLYNNIEWYTPGSCLEDVIEIDGVFCMDEIVFCVSLRYIEIRRI